MSSCLVLSFLFQAYYKRTSEEFSQITNSAGGGSKEWLVYAGIGVVVVGIIGLIFFFKNQKFKKFCIDKLMGFYEGFEIYLDDEEEMGIYWTYVFYYGDAILVQSGYLRRRFLRHQQFQLVQYLDHL